MGVLSALEFLDDQGNDEPLIADLLAADAACTSPHSVSYVFGDAYLYQHNPLFRWLRDELYRIGFVIHKDVGRRSATFGLVLLEEMLRLRRIYATDNRWGFEHVEALRPRHFRLRDLEHLGPNGNFLAHETAHAISTELFEATFTPAELAGSHRLRLLQHFVPEAFANTVDSAIFLASHADRLGRAFLRYHSYYRKAHVENMVDAARATAAHFGDAFFFRHTILGFVVANFGYSAATRPHLAEMLRLAGIEAADLPPGLDDHLFRVFQDTMRLGRVFALLTNQFYLQAVGFEGTIGEITNFCPFAALTEEPRLYAVIGQLATRLAEGFAGARPAAPRPTVRGTGAQLSN